MWLEDMEDLKELGKGKHRTEVNDQQWWGRFWPCMGCGANDDNGEYDDIMADLYSPVPNNLEDKTGSIFMT